MDVSLEARFARCPTLPSMPAVALEILRLCQRDDLDLGRIAEAAGRDPAVAAKLLRTANSASFATRARISTLTRAIALVGTNATVAIVLSFALLRSRRRSELNGFDHAAFWKRAVFAAIAGRALADLVGVEPEEAFLACLLQDLGMLAQNEVFAGEYGQVWMAARGDHEALVALEREVLGTDHREAGVFLAERWQLPEALRSAIAGSHDCPPRGAQDAQLGTVVYLSGRLADAWTSASSAEALRTSLSRAAQQAGVPSEWLTRALGRMAVAVPETAAEFDIDLGGPEDVERILATAQVALLARGAEAPARRDAGERRRSEQADVVLEAGFDHARRHHHPLSVLLVGGARADAAGPVVSASLRGLDVMATRKELVLAVLFDTPSVGARVAARRIVERGAEAGLGLVVGVASMEAPEAFATAASLCACAERALGWAGADPAHLAVCLGEAAQAPAPPSGPRSPRAPEEAP